MQLAIHFDDLDGTTQDRLLALLAPALPGVRLTQATLSLTVEADAVPVLATQGSPAVRYAIARHPHTPEAVLLTLADGPDPLALWWLSGRRRLSPAVATRLLLNPAARQPDNYWGALACLNALRCATLDPTVVVQVAQHPDAVVRAEARRHPCYPQDASTCHKEDGTDESCSDFSHHRRTELRSNRVNGSAS